MNRPTRDVEAHYPGGLEFTWTNPCLADRVAVVSSSHVLITAYRNVMSGVTVSPQDPRVTDGTAS